MDRSIERDGGLKQLWNEKVGEYERQKKREKRMRGVCMCAYVCVSTF